MPADPTHRFSDRVDDYVRARPDYPAAMVTDLIRHAGLSRGAAVADIGSGTGILTRHLLDAGLTVHAIEPNGPMRAVADQAFGAVAGYHSLDATAERTGLADHSVAAVTAAQAFHWFDPQATAEELRRILVPGGATALIWNERLVGTTPFLEAYEQLLLDFATDYTQVDHRRVSPEVIAAFFGSPAEEQTYDNHQHLDRDGLVARVRSSSYTPAPDDQRFTPMMQRLEAIFDAHAEDGSVTMVYTTRMFLGRF